jgi:hypothetical protein
MRFFFFLSVAVVYTATLHAQELYVATEPASNMPRHSIGIRLANEGMFQSDFKHRTNLEVMVGANKNLMLHGSAYLSDFYQKDQKFEGLSFYGKYRFLSIDGIQRHFRGAVFTRYSSVSNPLINEEINLEGDNSGIQAGLVLTQLIHKLGLSGSVSYTKASDNRDFDLLSSQADESIGYAFSSGYLLFPKVYKDYSQTNLNLYLEFLGKSNPGRGENMMDIAPAIQFIFNSKIRLDISQRFQLWGNLNRTVKNMYLLRLEYNMFNAL